jgi:hypothetical protein
MLPVSYQNASDLGKYLHNNYQPVFWNSISTGTKLHVYRLENAPFQGVDNIYEAVCTASCKASKDTINKLAEDLLW